MRHARQEAILGEARVLEVHVLPLQRLLEALALGDVAGGGEDALQLLVPVVEGDGV